MAPQSRGDHSRYAVPVCHNSLYARNVWTLTMSEADKQGPLKVEKESFLWWRHSFYRLRWKQWHINWLKLARALENDAGGPEDVLAGLEKAHCDPDVALRLAFFEASQKPATKSELAGDNKWHQHIKRKLSQSREHLLKAAALLQEQVAQSEIPRSDRNQRHVATKVDQTRNHILTGARELERALSGISLIFIKCRDVDSLKALAETVKPKNLVSLERLIHMCDCEIQTLLWPSAVELPPGHELFILVSYVTACSGDPHFALVTDLLGVSYRAYDPMRSLAAGAADAPSQDAIEKQVQRFRKLKMRYSILIDLIEESTAQRAKSGELRRELLTCYPDQPLED